MGTSEVIILAATSRLLMLLLQVSGGILHYPIVMLYSQALSNLLIPDHTASMSDVSLSGDRRPHPYLIDVILRGLSSWDGEHYLLIAEEGYKYEANLAFFPLYPLLIRALSTILSPLEYIGLEMHSITLLAGVTVNTVAFPIASYHLYKLTALHYPRDPMLPHLAVILFTINPANIFMSAVYTECLFSLFSFACIHCLFAGKSGRASLYLALACGTRSNGIALCIFVAMHHLHGIVTKLKLITIIRRLFLCISQLLFGLSPFICYQLYTAHKLQYNYTGVFPYSFIQHKHWGIGVMSYYQLKQLPNFLLAAPVLAISCSAVRQEAEIIYQLIRMQHKPWLRLAQTVFNFFLKIHVSK